MQQHGQRTAQDDHRAQNGKLVPVAGQHRAQHLAAQLEFQRQRDALRQLQAHAAVMAEILYDALHRRNHQHHDARQLYQPNANFGGILDNVLQKCNDSVHENVPPVRVHPPHNP